MKKLWVSTLGKWKDAKPLVTRAIESGAEAVLVDEENIEKVRKLGKITTATITLSKKAGTQTKKPGKIATSSPEKNSSTADIQIKKINSEKELTSAKAIWIEVDSKEKENLAVLAGDRCEYLIVGTKDWKVIPLENLIAKLHKKCKIVAIAESPEEAKTALETLEIGTYGVLLKTKKAEDIKKTAGIAEKAGAEKVGLKKAIVKKVQPVGIGDRVCIDTASMLKVGEGMLVGSQSKGMFLVHSETLESEYVNSRPFRVNAGAVHAYVKTPNNKTKYLSELQVGDEVLIVNSKGETSTAIIGRVKVERRPLMLLEAECEGKILKTLLQNAETIRLVSPEGKPISITALQVGDEILAYSEESARHFGTAVEETIIEK